MATNVTNVTNVTKRQMLRTLYHSKIIDMTVGSEARDNLANERTYLAWLRTAFATAAVGIVLVRFEMSSGTTVTSANGWMSKILACLFIVIGLMCIIIGSIRYAKVQILLEHQKYPTSGSITMILGVVSIVAFILTFILLLL